jgi:hypothetical protein
LKLNLPEDTAEFEHVDGGIVEEIIIDNFVFESADIEQGHGVLELVEQVGYC